MIVVKQPGRFKAQLRRAANVNKVRLKNLATDFIAEMYENIIMSTRVDTGKMRGGWFGSNTLGGTSDPNVLDPVGLITVNKALDTIRPFGRNYLSNTVEYVSVWEERDAMVGRALAQSANTLRALTRAR